MVAERKQGRDNFRNLVMEVLCDARINEKLVDKFSGRARGYIMAYWALIQERKAELEDCLANGEEVPVEFLSNNMSERIKAISETQTFYRIEKLSKGFRSHRNVADMDVAFVEKVQRAVVQTPL